MNKKQLSEAEIVSRLRQGKIGLPSVTLQYKGRSGKGVTALLDGLVEVEWSGQKALFMVEIKANSTPKAFMEALAILKNAKLPRGVLPMVIMPYLSEERLRALEGEGISGIDLCGNGLVIARNKFTMFRTGQENQFPSYAPIKNIYRKNSSLVSRLFMVRSVFSSVDEVLRNVRDLDMLSKAMGRSSINQSTVSKALSEMEKDLLISRNTGRIVLLQPEALLEKLVMNYKRPEIRSTMSLKVDLDRGALLSRLSIITNSSNNMIMVDGLSSVTRYAVMQRGEGIALYVARPDELIGQLPAKETDKFADLTVNEVLDIPPYFDGRMDNGILWASPLQSYLELMDGDKRDRETAQQVKTDLLLNITKVRK